MSDAIWLGRWRRPEKTIWELVCGFPDDLARKKRLLMLQLYVDDSGKPDQSKVQIMAGYLSSAERWAIFTNEWRGILDGAGIKGGFHMVEAWRLSTTYRHLGPIGRDKLLIDLIACIRRNVEMAFVSVVPFQAFDAHLMVREKEHYLGRPYFFGIYAMMQQVYQYAYEQQFDAQVEVTFDEVSNEPQSSILQGFFDFKAIASASYPDLILPQPIFRNDEHILPLQAADMLAWLIRRDDLSRERGVSWDKSPENVLMWEALSMSHNISVWTEDRMAKAGKVLSGLLDEALAQSLSSGSKNRHRL